MIALEHTRQQVELAVQRAGSAPQLDTVAEEVPVAFEYNGIIHTVMLATPADFEDFAQGFSLSEGIVARRNDVFVVEVTEAAEGITLLTTNRFTPVLKGIVIYDETISCQHHNSNARKGIECPLWSRGPRLPHLAGSRD